MNVTIVTFCHYDAVVRAQFDSIHVNQLNSIRVNNINTSSVSMLVAVVDAWVLLSSMSMPGCHVLALRADAHCFHDSCTQAMLQSPNQYFGPAQYISYVQQDINHMSQIRSHIHKSSRQSLILINNKNDEFCSAHQHFMQCLPHDLPGQQSCHLQQQCFLFAAWHKPPAELWRASIPG